MTRPDIDAIRYTGAPQLTEGGAEVLAFHFHRYLATWLEQERRARVLVTVGFENSEVQSATFDASIARCEIVEVAWTFEDLCRIYRQGDGRLHVEQRGESGHTVVYDLVPLLDTPVSGGEARVLLGFALVDEADVMGPDGLGQLAAQATEAIRAARRNAMRLFFDDMKTLPIKTTLYGLMEHLPEWTGCDHSAAMLMTSSLEAMTLGSSGESRFDFLAERLYCDDDEGAPRRLVGMSVSLSDATAGFLGQAVERQARDPEQPIQIYVRSDDDPQSWCAIEDGDDCVPSFHHCEERADESMYVLVPLLAHDVSETELLGFVSLVYKHRRELAASTRDILDELSQNLSSMLRYSPLYTLNARKLWILRQTRAALEEAIVGSNGANARVESLIGEVTSLIVEHVDIPSFAIAYMRREGDNGAQKRFLRYAHPHGWTHFEQLNLPVDVDFGEHADSGVSSLAVRINRPLVLAGGRGEGDQLAFKNYLFVDETRGVVIDARSPQAAGVADETGWVRLSDYYKPARSSSYATLAYPISFGGEPLGVISLEVERSTSWLWWTGFGAQLFWSLLANELAYAFHALGVGGQET
ncbi:hypothetical protein FIV42_25510 [Persicimonas caeni]|uniref:GAF domain-containing protein n=1 Tax=Persicimonas caeni TaxID=2292766 RepID=A0A4Y6Q172_PERCE|nr:hypothetical protein [Persicimonas caeni]QDG53977.1 hypothetical protein FIV42_25510 [Persicimonas caeni]QED35198.1 hypothetical protein FRD00_25505 [Persicimonas caeni]